MAWGFKRISSSRWVVDTELTPSSSDLIQARNEYQLHSTVPWRFGPIHAQGIRVPAELFPTEARMTSSVLGRTLDFLTIAGMGVSERIKDIIEALEPGKHFFYEVKTFLRNGDKTPLRYYCIVIGTVIERQIVQELSDPRLFPLRSFLLENDNSVTLTIDRSQTRGCHLWYCPEMKWHTYISDEMKSEFMKAGVRGQQYRYLDEVYTDNGDGS